MAVPTCWVLDHPAHMQILAGFIRGGSTSDILILSDRPEVRSLFELSEGILPRRQTLWVNRPVGKGKRMKAGSRLLASTKALKGTSVQRVVVIGAAIELWAARKAGIPERWYISDTEVNHVAHGIALKNATHALLPNHWRTDLDDGFLSRFKGVIHRYDGLHGHIHIRLSIRPSEVSEPPKVLLRRLQGGGIHDDAEIVEIPDSFLEGLNISAADEGDNAAWNLPSSLSSYDGVLTQSVTLASEAVLQGVPTLLITGAERGFLDELQRMGLPIHIERGDNLEQSQSEWLTGMHLSDTIDAKEWPPIKEQWIELFGDFIEIH